MVFRRITSYVLTHAEPNCYRLTLSRIMTVSEINYWVNDVSFSEIRRRWHTFVSAIRLLPPRQSVTRNSDTSARYSVTAKLRRLKGHTRTVPSVVVP